MDPVTAALLLATEIAKCWQVWFLAQKPDVQQSGGDRMLAAMERLDDFLDLAKRGAVPPKGLVAPDDAVVSASPRRSYGEPA